MSDWNGYILISEVPPGWTVEQRQNAYRAMREQGNQDNRQPNLKTHGRPNLAGTAWIVEGVFTDAEQVRSYWVQTIADELGVTYAAVDAKLQVVFCGGMGCSWDDSHEDVLQYLDDNKSEWDG
ncbi:MAG: hypothetical protein GTO60_16730 [Gammaproteobacteria bacterium]|nr:hypothetical protein [Gammaproteobacteria bacterium]